MTKKSILNIFEKLGLPRKKIYLNGIVSLSNAGLRVMGVMIVRFAPKRDNGKTKVKNERSKKD